MANTNNGRRAPTMSDVAKLAGVSQPTVSLVINNVENANIPAATRERIWDAVKKLSYRPNAAAQQLRTRRSHTIGFITDKIASTPFAGKIIDGAQQQAWTNDKLLLVVNTGNNPKMKQAAIDLMLERQVEGVIFASYYHQVVNVPPNLYQLPTVLLDCYCPDRSLPSVVPDEVGGGRRATEILINKGHRRIGFINLQPNLAASIGRLEGYKQALAAANIEFDPVLVREGNSNADLGYECALQLMKLDERPTAIFCGTDRTAMGAYDALRTLNLRVPQDVAIIGFDNQELIAAYLRPPLSTLALPHYEMGQWAIQHLLELVEKADEGSPIQHLIECPYIERASL
jgi:LacI family transcriptional regulator